MKFDFYRLSSVAAIVVIALLTLCSPAPAVVLDRIVAVVNNDAITWLELYEVMRTEMASKLKGISEDEQREVLASMEADYLETLILRKLQLQEAARADLGVSDEELDATIENIRTKYGFTLEEFKEALEDSGTQWDYYRVNLREQIIIRKIVDREVTSAIQEGGGAPDLDGDISYHLKQIFLSAERGEQALQEAVQSVYDSLQAGTEFESLAIRVSDGSNASSGGDIGVVEESMLSSEMRAALKGLAEGRVTQPIATSKGVHILKLEKKISEDEMKMEARFQARYSEWLSELHGKAQIDIRL